MSAAGQTVAALLAALATATGVTALLGGAHAAAARRLATLLATPRRAHAERRSAVRHVAVGATVLVVGLGALASPLLGLALGLVLGAVLWWRTRARRTDARRNGDRIADDLPMAADLLGTALRAGCPLPNALVVVAGALGGPVGAELATAARQLELGARPDRIWHQLAEPADLASLGRVLARAGRTGAPLAAGLAGFATDCRNRLRTRGVARAHRVSVLVVLPLGACFLPAFVLLGVVPLAVGLVDGLSMP